MDWHITWQDPVAWLLAVLGLAGAWWLKRRYSPAHGCGDHPACHDVSTGELVTEESLSLHRKR